MLPISQSSQRQFASALDYTEQYLRARSGSGDEIEVLVAHPSGPDLLREDASPLSERIKIITQQYDNVRFIACVSATRLLRDRVSLPGA